MHNSKQLQHLFFLQYTDHDGQLLLEYSQLLVGQLAEELHRQVVVLLEEHNLVDTFFLILYKFNCIILVNIYL
jgi:hypothetical protein